MRKTIVLGALAIAACNLPYPTTATSDAPPGTPDGQPALVDAAPGTLAVQVASGRFYLRVGGTVSVGITISRGAGVDGDVAIALESPPTGVTADALTIPTGSTTGTLVLHATADAQVGRGTTGVKGTVGTASGTGAVDLDVIGTLGTLDPTFGTSGTASVDRSGATPVAIFAQGDDTVVVEAVHSGTSYEAVLTRLQDSGAVDSSFGTVGVATYDFAQLGVNNGLSLTAISPSDGSVVVAGYGGVAGSNQALIARFASSGDVDTALGPRIIDPTAKDDHVNTIFANASNAPFTTDDFVLGGSTGASDTSQHAMLMPLTSSGSLDTNHGPIVDSGSTADQFDSLLLAGTSFLGISQTIGLTPPQASFELYNGAALSLVTVSMDDTNGIPSSVAMGFPNSSGGFLVWGDEGGEPTAGATSTFAIWQCVTSAQGYACGSGGVGAVYASAKTTRTESVVTVMALPDGSGLAAIGFDEGENTSDIDLDVIGLSLSLAPMPGVGTDGIVNDSSVALQPIAAAVHDDHRIDVLAIQAPVNAPKLVVRRYFW